MNRNNVVAFLKEERERIDEAIGILDGNTKPPKRRRAMSEAAKRRISLAQKKRWAKVRRAA